MKKIRDIFNSVYQDANAMTMFDATIANFTVSNAMLSIKKIVEGFAFEHECEQGKKYIILLDDIAKLFESEGR